MNTRRLMTLGYAGLFLFLAVTALLATGNAPVDNEIEPRPIHAPAPVTVEASTVNGASQDVAQSLSQAAPQPEPVRVAPGREGRAPTAVSAPSVPTAILLSMLVASTVVLGMGLVVGRLGGDGRPAHRSTLAEGV